MRPVTIAAAIIAAGCSPTEQQADGSVFDAGPGPMTGIWVVAGEHPATAQMADSAGVDVGRLAIERWDGGFVAAVYVDGDVIPVADIECQTASGYVGCDVFGVWTELNSAAWGSGVASANYGHTDTLAFRLP